MDNLYGYELHLTLALRSINAPKRTLSSDLVDVRLNREEATGRRAGMVEAQPRRDQVLKHQDHGRTEICRFPWTTGWHGHILRPLGDDFWTPGIKDIRRSVGGFGEMESIAVLSFLLERDEMTSDPGRRSRGLAERSFLRLTSSRFGNISICQDGIRYSSPLRDRFSTSWIRPRCGGQPRESC